jgi:hypothetical protein
MAEHFRTMAFTTDTERLLLRLRTKDDAECNLELLREHEGGTTLSIGEVEQRLVERNDRGHVDGFGYWVFGGGTRPARLGIAD